MLNIGDTILIETPPNGEHLFIVITKICYTTYVLCVNVTSKRDNSDLSCVIKPYEHSFIKKESVINYKDAIFPRVEELEKMLNSGKAKKLEPVSKELINRIITGGKKTRYLLNKYVNL